MSIGDLACSVVGGGGFTLITRLPRYGLSSWPKIISNRVRINIPSSTSATWSATRNQRRAPHAINTSDLTNTTLYFRLAHHHLHASKPPAHRRDHPRLEGTLRLLRQCWSTLGARWREQSHVFSGKARTSRSCTRASRSTSSQGMPLVPRGSQAI